MSESGQPEPTPERAIDNAPEVVADLAAEARVPVAPAIRERERPGVVQWLLFFTFTLICLVVLYMSLSGQQQLPLP